MKQFNPSIISRRLMYLTIVGCIWSSAAIGASATVVFSNNPAKQGEQIDPGAVKQRFACGESIYAVTGIDGLTKGSYQLETRWTDPSGELAKTDQGQMDVPLDGQIIYLATSLQIQSSNTQSDSAADSPYNGKWSVEVLSDGVSIGQGNFEFDC